MCFSFASSFTFSWFKVLPCGDRYITFASSVLTGGEIPAMAITDTITRLIPGVINNESLVSESFNDEYLDYPQYTRPASFRGMDVPEVLLSGHHENIKKYREEQRRELTRINKES